METKVPVETLETPTEATGSPSEGSGQSWGLFSSRRPHLPQPFPLCFANPPCVRNPRAVTSVPSPSVPSPFPPRDWASASARRLPPADSTASPASNASLGSPPPSGPRLPQSATAAGVEPPPPPLSRRLPPSPSVWCRAVRRPPFGTDRKRSKLGSWARTSARALGTHGWLKGTGTDRRRPPQRGHLAHVHSRTSILAYSVRHPILCRLCSGVSDALNV